MDDEFKAKIQFLSFVISKLNTSNIILQKQTLPIYQLQSEIKNCFSQVLSFFIRRDKFTEDFQILLKQNCKM